ncbi:MAG: hypothetical protein WDN00_09195 [Limisphaerales bacterium]
MLRYFENRSLKELGGALGVEERAAQKRVTRGLEKLRTIFARRDVILTTTIIAGTVSANSVQAAPVALAKTVTAIAVGKGAVVSVSTLTLIKGAFKIMAWSKAKTAIVVSVVVLLTTGTSIVTAKKIQDHRHKLQQQQTIIKIAPNGSMRLITPSELSQLRQSNQSKGQAATGIGFKTVMREMLSSAN